MKSDLYFERQKFFFNEISNYGIDPYSDIASFLYDKFHQNIIKYERNQEVECLEDTVKKYGKVYKRALKKEKDELFKKGYHDKYDENEDDDFVVAVAWSYRV